MIARVIILKRLPRALGIFDYFVPADLLKKIRPGQLITIPFRQSIVYGLILSVAEDAPVKELKPIASLIHPVPLISQKQLQLIQTVSAWYGISVATAASLCVLPLQKRKLAGITVSPYHRITVSPVKRKKTKPAFALYTNEASHKDRLSSAIRGATLILVPEVHLIDEVFHLLPADLQKKTIIWHSEFSIKEQFGRWLKIRNSKFVIRDSPIIIGTRSAVFLPFPKLDTIIIDYEHDENHKHWDQNPRFHAKDTAVILSKLHGANLHLMSFSPSCESYYNVHKKNYTVNTSTFRLPPSAFRLIDLLDERRARRFGILADEVETAIRDAAHDIFFFVPRRGFATTVGCNDCGRVEKCPTCELPYVYHDDGALHCHYCRVQVPLPAACANCRRPVLALSGAGTQTVEKQARQLLGATYDIIRIDSESAVNSSVSNLPRAVVGTQMALSAVRWDKTRLIIFIDIDKQLGIPEYTAGEKVWHLLHEVQFRKLPEAAVYIQTRNPRHPVLRGITEPDRFYRTDLNARQGFQYPPYTYAVRYLFSHASAIIAKKEAHRVFALLQGVLALRSPKGEGGLTEAKKNITILNPVELQPKFYRGRYWWMILAKLPPQSWATYLIWLNSHIPGNWKIDPNPISLLSP